ncbi:uncharacterized protein LOC5575136 isoform X2 [Aedes aegypti]|uniref:Uncharacterized protein n=1 Tax=Aedes aegypti TaxID=7159 RepID=A0A6I8T3D9_AEDAE|nr:uncharacterized protein LOC5575136 isoform X2 [Aedes aegypti]
MSEQIEPMSLPPGWDCKYDARTGRYYYVNLFTKTTTWEDPRARIRQLQTGAPLHISNDSISVQPVHGSPYHVYPSSNSFYPAQQAFQNPPSGVPSLTASPNLATKLQQQQQQQQPIELSPMVRSSPHTPRMGLGRHAMQETSFSNNTSAADTDATVAKINSMFPTVPETHIRMLLKKYYNREAVVISALQVEKHPLTTPGPYSTPPLPQRHFHNTAMGVVSAFQMTPVLSGRSEVSTSRTASPVPRPASCASGSYYGYQHGSPRSNGFDIRYNSPKPHSSPKMRLRYLKSFFPKADEDLILDVLANADNNVQTASQQLIKLGYEKREQSANQRGSSRKGSEKDGQSQSAADAKRAESQTPTAKPKSHDEKKKIKARLQAKYKDIAERIILMALESVDYSEERAKQILNIVIQEDKEKKKSVKIDAPHKPEEDKENAQAGSSTPSRNNSTSSNHVRPPKKGAATTPDEHPKKASSEIQSGTDPDPTAADNENATDASIEITTSTTNSTAIINDSPQSPLSPSQQQQQQKEHCDSGNYPPQSVTEGTADNSSSATAIASTTANKPPSRARAKTDHAKSSSSEDELDGPSSAAHRSDKMSSGTNIPRIASKGPNAKLFKGPNDDLLLADYVTWNGANPDLAKGSQKLALGPDRSIRLDRGTYKARGPNADLCKGPAAGLAKGSMYAQLNCSLTDVKCN